MRKDYSRTKYIVTAYASEGKFLGYKESGPEHAYQHGKAGLIMMPTAVYNLA